MNHKILLVITNMRGGGAERVVAQLLRRLDRRCFQPVLVVFQEENVFAGEIPPDIKIICLHKRHNFDLPRIVGGLSRVILQEAPALMLSFLTDANCFAIMAHRFARTGIPLLISERNNLSLSLNQVRMSPLKKYLARRLYPRADLVLCVSEGVKEDLVENFGLPPEKCVVQYNPCDLERIQAWAQEEVEHPWFQQDIPLVLACGRLTVQKNYPLLLRAVKRVAAIQPVRLMILGEGEERSRLEAEVARAELGRQVTFLGFQKNPYQFMARANHLVLSSSWEGFPNVLLEAMACGTPVVSTRCPSGPEEIIRDGENGLLVPVNDHQALAQAILRLLGDGFLRQRLAAAGQKRAADFHLDRIVRSYELLLDKTLREKTRRNHGRAGLP